MVLRGAYVIGKAVWLQSAWCRLTCRSASHSVRFMSKTMICGCLALLLVGLIPVTAFSAEVSGLYESEVLVHSQKRSERAQAMAAALAEVLVKVSGRSNVAQRDDVAQAIRRPASLLQQYRYRALPDEVREQELASLEPAARSGAEPQTLYFRFDKNAVDKVLHDHGLPVWGSTRPATLAWVAVQDENERYLVGSASTAPLRQLLEQEARRRGMALLLPLMDLEDQRALRFGDVWGGFRDPILRASTRYQPESVLVGRLFRPLGGEWQAQWTLLEGGQIQSWGREGALPAEVIDQGVTGAVKVLAARYAPLTGDQSVGLLPLTVTEVRNLSDYARVARYLQSLQQVEQVQVLQVEADRITFELDAKGGAEGIAQLIALGNVLAPYQASANDAGAALPAWQSAQVRHGQIYRLIP